MGFHCYEINIMARQSKAQLVRALRGITQEKNPKLVSAGKKGAATVKATREGQTLEQTLKQQRQSDLTRAANKLPKGGKQALNEVLVQESRRAANIEQYQDIRKTNALNLMLENGENIGKRLVKLALGQDDFKDAPASVQRLAMLDVLSLAGITTEHAEKQAKPVHEMNKDELISFIHSTQKLINYHERKQSEMLIDGELVES